jgi:hypothetical protein
MSPTDQTPLGITPDSAPSDNYRHALDLTVTHRTFKRGDILVWLTWLRRADRQEACMVLTPSNIMVTHEKVIPCVVPLSQAWKWTEEVGDEDHAMITGAIFCANLGFNPYNPKNVFKIVGIIREYLGDLISTPPRPTDVPRAVAAVMEISNGSTGKTKEIEVTDDA